MRTTSIPALEAFIAGYRDTYYAELARLRIEELKKQQVVIGISPKASVPVAEAWAAVKDTTSIPALEAFIASYRDTYYAELVRLRIEELKKQQVVIGISPKASVPVAEAWAAVKDTTSIPALEAFIAHYRDTYYAELVRLRIEELKRQQVVI